MSPTTSPSIHAPALPQMCSCCLTDQATQRALVRDEGLLCTQCAEKLEDALLTPVMAHVYSDDHRFDAQIDVTDFLRANPRTAMNWLTHGCSDAYALDDVLYFYAEGALQHPDDTSYSLCSQIYTYTTAGHSDSNPLGFEVRLINPIRFF